jgi:hypothetical protein
MDICTTAPVSSASSTTSRAQPVLSMQQQAAQPPGLGIRLPQAGVLSLLPAPSADVIAPCATPPQLQPATDLLNLPDDLLFRLPGFLRTANTIPEIRNVARFRAACRALYLGHVDMAIVLINAGAWVDHSITGHNALMYAARRGRTATVDALLGAGANCRLEGKEGKTALSLSIEKKRAGVIKLLRAYGAAD